MTETKHKETFEEKAARKRREAEAEARQLAQQAADDAAAKQTEKKGEEESQAEDKRSKGSRAPSFRKEDVVTLIQEQITPLLGEVQAQREIVVELRKVIETLQAEKHVITLRIPTYGTFMEWCAAHASNTTAAKITRSTNVKNPKSGKKGGGWSGVVRNVLDVLRDMQEGN